MPRHIITGITFVIAIACLTFAKAPDKAEDKNPVKPAEKKSETTTTEVASSGSATMTKLQAFDKVSLRGYGTLSGTYWAGGGGSGILEIFCESEDKAKLLQAKYLSDIQLLPRVKQFDLKSKTAKISAWEVEEQGALAALRIGSKVYIIGSPDLKILMKLAEESSRLGGGVYTSTSEAEVPMWLDRWDKFGFRFYYRTWERPPGETASTYDVFEEFEYADKTERSGFVFWSNPDPMDTAEGLNNEPYWGWARDAAVAKKVPMALNIMSGSPGNSWLTNRYREQNAQKAPYFSGNYHKVADGGGGGNGFLSWSSTIAKDEELAIAQESVREASKFPNLTTILEPHGELRHGEHDIFMEYGPVADATYREYLKAKYKTVENLSKSWDKKIASWNDVTVPEAASFLGWGTQALDLAGEWRIEYEKFAGGKSISHSELNSDYRAKIVPTEPAPANWFAENFNDSAWAKLYAPGSDKSMFLPMRPAVFRRTISVPGDWLSKNKRVWLYLWDLNTGSNNEVKVALNGKIVGQSKVAHAVPHWNAFEVTGVVKSGSNQLTLRLPKGIIAYRIYLSPDEPKQYPNLGDGMNMQWVDFTDWIGWTRVKMAQRGMEMIRQAEPNRQIDLMSPGFYADGMKKLAVKYGGNFKNTGYMGAFFADDLPTMMRGAGMPFSLEPGGPADDLQGFKKMMGLYSIEGVHAIDYFIHIGNIMWNEEIRKNFEETLPMIKLIGKFHSPKAEIAAFYSIGGKALTGFPWGQDLDTNLGGGYWQWNIRANLMDLYESDAVTESAFAEGEAAKYKVIIDSNTSIMDDELIAQIEKYVKDGGTFVTFVQTGRHTPSKKDAWPISRLTGYEVTKIDKLDKDGNNAIDKRSLKLADGQDIFTGNWSTVPANGLSLKKVADDAKDLLLWDDGSVAVGMRQIGKGYIVNVGCKFSGKKIPDRYETGGQKGPDMALTDLMSSILKWREIKPIELKLAEANSAIFQRHYISNNGLYDVWVVWNESGKEPNEGELVLPPTACYGWAWDVEGKKQISVPQGRIPFKLEPFDHKMFLTPRGKIGSSFVEWFELQRNWWKGTDAPPSTPLPKPAHKLSVDLSRDWAFKPLVTEDDISQLTGATADDASWDKIRLCVWTGNPKYRGVKRGLLRKTFTVPKEWDNGTPTLWISSWIGPDFLDKARIWLDGELIGDGVKIGPRDLNKDVLKPGTQHTLAIEITGGDYLVGSRANAWLWYWPKPVQTIDLAGEWIPSKNMLQYESPIKLPGDFNAFSMRRSIQVPADLSDKSAVVNIDAEGQVLGVLINGRWIRRLHHTVEDHFQIAITPWVKFGAENEIEVVMRGNATPSKGKMRTISLEFHDKSVYP